MKDVAEQVTKQGHLFAVGSLPIGHLVTTPVGGAMMEAFRWRDVDAPEVGRLVLGRGELVIPGREQAIPVHGVEIDARRIHAAVWGSSDDARLVLDKLEEILEEKAGWLRSDPLVITHETTCTVTLSFEWRALVSEAVFAFGRTTVPKMTPEAGARPEVVGVHFALRLTYPPVARIADHGIELTSKELRIEPRTGTPPQDRRYFTQSPTDSSTHSRLLEELEKAVCMPTKRRR